MTDLNTLLPYISMLGVIVAIYLGFKNSKRDDTQDSTKIEKELTKLSATMDNVRDGVDDIRIEFRSQQNQINNLSERVVRVEESDKSAHKRIDKIEERQDKFEGGKNNAE